MKIIRVTINDNVLVKCENKLEYKNMVFPVEIPYSDEDMAWAVANCVEGEPEVIEREVPKQDTSTTDDVLNTLLGVSV